MSLTITLNDNGLSKTLSRSMREKFPRAVVTVINKVTYNAMQALRAGEKSSLKLTRSFIPNSTQYDGARFNGNVITSEVGLLDRVKFAERLVDGGERRPVNSKYIAVPLKKGRRMKPATLLAKADHFITEIGGTKYIAKHSKGRLSPSYVLKPVTEYDKAPYLDFEPIVINSVKSMDYEGMLQKSILNSLGL